MQLRTVAESTSRACDKNTVSIKSCAGSGGRCPSCPWKRCSPGVLIGASVGAGYIVYSLNTRRLMARYGEELRVYNSGAFTPLVEASPHQHFDYVTRLAAEMISRKGQRAISVMTVGLAIHHINQDGTFSAKGPYFVSWRSSNWQFTGRTHLVKVLRGQGGRGFKPDHSKQRGNIHERGIAVIEYPTTKYYALTIRQFAERQAASRSLIE